MLKIFVGLSILLLICGVSYAENRYEDFSTYVEVDSGSDISTNKNVMTVSSIQRLTNSYVYKDFGEGHFGDFIINCEVKGTTGGDAYAICDFWGLNNEIPCTHVDVANEYEAIQADIRIDASGSQWQLNFEYYRNGSYINGGIVNISIDTQYYVQFVRNKNIMSMHVYSDKAMNTLVGGVNLDVIDLHFRYMKVLGSRDDGSGTQQLSFIGQNYEIVKADNTKRNILLL